MFTASLRKVGGSVMLTVPPIILKSLQLDSGSLVNMAIESDRLVVKAVPQKKYSLQELLAQCDPSAPMSEEDAHWVDSQTIGKELI